MQSGSGLEGEAEGVKIRALGQAKAQETITKTLTPEYLRYKLYDSPNAKMVLLPDNLNVPILINPDLDRGGKASPENSCARTGPRPRALVHVIDRLKGEMHVMQPMSGFDGIRNAVQPSRRIHPYVGTAHPLFELRQCRGSNDLRCACSS